MSTIYFLHLQKTAGTSINDAAIAEFTRERVLLVYGNDSQWTSNAAKEIRMAAKDRADHLRRLADYIETHGIAYFASHMAATGLSSFDPGRAFTILRDPVERVISQYFFFRQQRRTDETLEAFVERPENRNHQSQKLMGVDLEHLAAVGVTERFAPFVAHLNERLGTSFKVVHRKRGGLVKDFKSSRVNEAVRRRIAELNSADADLYRRALAIAARRGV